MRNFRYEGKATILGSTAFAGTTAGTTTFTSTGFLDMAGYESVAFIGMFNLTATAYAEMYARFSDSSAFGSPVSMNSTAGSTCIAGTTSATVGDNQLALLDIYQPGHRYISVGVVKGTANCAIPLIIALQYNGQWSPTIGSTGGALISAVSLISPTTNG